ncbi:AAA family ATPase [Methanobrevibacter sp. YE315]|uniref:AAA family ATPase n=1 Tax=Methanobrevibacter sp. YE315 TaxID=1609968 RepID=UPI00082D9681|nr:AAA family ATPase [Methanobrevibacter sp. YE315]
MKLKINDVGPISNADIDISKINVIGGVNSSGKSTISKLLYCYFKSQNDDESFEYLMDSEGLSEINDNNVTFEGNLSPQEVFYIDNISILDLKDLDILRVDHIIHIKEALEEPDETIESENIAKIQNIINDDCLKTTSSGIKEIGIIVLLLKNNRLKENSFLIIDEPEASLHPEWQIKFAEILVLLVRDLNIHIYLNSNSSMFIEAISLYAHYYDLLNETNFYLTHKTANGKFSFKKIYPKNMGEVYENLTKAYDELDKIKAKILFKG